MASGTINQKQAIGGTIKPANRLSVVIKVPSTNYIKISSKKTNKAELY